MKTDYRVFPWLKHLSGQHDQHSHGRGSSGEISPPTEGAEGLRAGADKHISQGAAELETQRAAAKAKIVKDVSARVLAKMSGADREEWMRRGIYTEGYSVGDGATVRLEKLAKESKEFGDQLAQKGVEQYVNRTLKTWAESSDGDSAQSIALQIAAAREFGAPGARERFVESMRARSKEITEIAEDHDASHGKLTQQVLRAMYENTQEQLAKEGIKEVVISRGIGVPAEGSPGWVSDRGKHDGVEMNFRPLNSFSAERATAKSFALRKMVENRGSYSGVVIDAEVPVSRIFSTARTGLGCLTEYEYVVIGGRKAKVSAEVL